MKVSDVIILGLPPSLITRFNYSNETNCSHFCAIDILIDNTK